MNSLSAKNGAPSLHIRASCIVNHDTSVRKLLIGSLYISVDMMSERGEERAAAGERQSDSPQQQQSSDERLTPRIKSELASSHSLFQINLPLLLIKLSSESLPASIKDM